MKPGNLLKQVQRNGSLGSPETHLTVLLDHRVPLADLLFLLLIGGHTLSLLRYVLGQGRVEHFVALVGLGEHFEQLATFAGNFAIGLAQGVQDLERFDLVDRVGIISRTFKRAELSKKMLDRAFFLKYLLIVTSSSLLTISVRNLFLKFDDYIFRDVQEAGCEKLRLTSFFRPRTAVCR